VKRYRVKVHKNGIIVIPKEIREMIGIKEEDIVELVVNEGKVSIEKPETLLDLFGIDGNKAVEVARAIVKERKLKVRH